MLFIAYDERKAHSLPLNVIFRKLIRTLLR